MKVKLLISRAGPAGVRNAGDVIDVSEAEAKRLFEAVPPKAVPARDDPSIETATKTATVKRKPKRKG